MIYKCNDCNTEMNLMKGAKYCPLCGKEISAVDIEKKVSDLHNAGKSVKEISTALQLTVISVEQILAKAADNGDIKTESLIQDEYASAIEAIMAGEWDGKMKTIKESLDPACTYTTINYYARRYRKKKAQERRNNLVEKRNIIANMLRAGKDIKEISAETDTSVYGIEKILVEEIEKDRAVANPYINQEYKARILEIVNDPEWDGKLRTIKEKVPEEVTYTNIKATIAKNR